MTDLALVLLSALFGVATHILKKLVEAQRASAEPNTLAGLGEFVSAYFVGHFLELLLMLFLVLGALLISAELGELTFYTAYLTGYAGNSLVDVVGKRSAALAEKVAGK